MCPSNVILVSNINNIFKTAREIHNIFSCFGNIVKILFMKNLQKAMVEYYCATSSRSAADNINSFRMKGTVLKVNYSKYNQIDLRRNNKTENSIFYNDVFIPMKSDHRFVNEKL